jgi:mono/diheme cytochrome c family protein
MPPWERQLTEPQRQQLVDYVRSLFQGAEDLGDGRRVAAERRNR